MLKEKKTSQPLRSRPRLAAHRPGTAPGTWQELSRHLSARRRQLHPEPSLLPHGLTRLPAPDPARCPPGRPRGPPPAAACPPGDPRPSRHRRRTCSPELPPWSPWLPRFFRTHSNRNAGSCLRLAAREQRSHAGVGTGMGEEKKGLRSSAGPGGFLLE